MNVCNRGAGVVVAVAIMTVTSIHIRADEGPPDPISLDRNSPSVIGFGETPGNIYDMLVPGDPRFGRGWDHPSPNGPVVHVFDTSYGLVSPGDNNDGHSNGEAGEDQQLLLYFSGDDASVGAAGTDYNHQATRSQAAGDRFVTNGPTTLSPAAVMGGAGPAAIAGPLLPGGAGNFSINLLSANQHRYNEIPSIGPGAFNTYVPPAGATVMDDMDALELTPFDLNGDQVHDTPVYFSLDAISPTLGAGGWSPADVLLSPPGGGPVQYAPATALGLTTNDEVDALAVFDMDQALQPRSDFALFSLAPNSPFLSTGPFSPADIFVTDFTGFNRLFLPSQAFGMLPTDNVDAIDVELWPVDLRGEILDVVPLPSAGTAGLLMLLACAGIGRRRRRT